MTNPSTHLPKGIGHRIEHLYRDDPINAGQAIEYAYSPAPSLANKWANCSKSDLARSNVVPIFSTRCAM